VLDCLLTAGQNDSVCPCCATYARAQRLSANWKARLPKTWLTPKDSQIVMEIVVQAAGCSFPARCHSGAAHTMKSIPMVGQTTGVQRKHGAVGSIAYHSHKRRGLICTCLGRHSMWRTRMWLYGTPVPMMPAVLLTALSIAAEDWRARQP
jgi:hypothetical protein